MSATTRLAFEKDLPRALSQADNLPSLPAVAMEVLRLCQDEEATMTDLANCVSKDASLATKLLKLANSPLFGLGKEVTTLQRATMVLGMKTVKLMSLSFSLLSSVQKRGQPGDALLMEFWRRSLIGAVASRSLGRLVKNPASDEAFLCGLLGHFGKLVLARCLAKEYAEVLTQAGPWPSLAEEERLLGFNSQDVGATVLKTWELPKLIYMSVGYAGRAAELPADADSLLRGLVQLLEVAKCVEGVLCDVDKGTSLAHLHEGAQRHYGLPVAEINAFLVGLESGIKETAELLSVELPPGTSHEELLNQARMQIVNVSLGAALDLQQEKRRSEELETKNRELSDRARTDALTGLANRAAFDEFLASHVAPRLRGSVPSALGVIMIDVDRFKLFNDTYGHPAGDKVLARIGAVLRKHTRKGDLAARYGGEEFALVVPYTTVAGLGTLAERLRQAIAAERLSVDGHELSVTASFGGACSAVFRAEADASGLVKLADQCLYRAKSRGRNRSEIHPEHAFAPVK
jgi:diguanylate cyclase (GGDEF)-like protein